MVPPTGRAREVVSAGAVVLGSRRHGAAGAPAEVRRLVLPQGQARPRRARDRGRGARGRGGDRTPGPARRSAAQPALPDPGRASSGCTTGSGARWATATSAATSRTPRSTRSRGSRSTRRGAGSPTSSTSTPSTRRSPHAQKTRTLVVLRHSQARSRKAWRSDDRMRPLLATGKHQAERLVPRAGGVRRPPAGQLDQHPVRPDPRAVRRGRPAASCAPTTGSARRTPPRRRSATCSHR